MPDNDALCDVRERTKNPEHAAVDNVVDLILERAQHPRTEHQDAHLDEMMATVVDRYGREPVRTVKHFLKFNLCAELDPAFVRA